ncbi:hypothetical protein CRM22_004108 [Opisthorchis felineus]|uniref:Uncharacterized protein n=1 Tax=Opisthorchis felineus TaxID=147828 RepID=A0A4S2LXT8_OPIFE|nr:hypothetical protein CRM22_004108 [Opisthorchis felineus]
MPNVLGAMHQISNCRLSIGDQGLAPNDCLRLFHKLTNLFLYQSGQFPDFTLMQKPKTAYEYLRSCKETDAHKVVKFLDSLQELEQHMSELPFPVHYCLILLGGLPSHPKRAFLVDFVGSSSPDTFADEVIATPSTPNRSEPIFSDFFRSFVQHPFYQLLMEGVPPTRTFFYFYMPTTYESKWFLPRPNFRLFRKCPVYVLQILTDSKHSMIIDDLEADRCLLDINEILYGESSDRMWYASPVSVEGFRGGVV